MKYIIKISAFIILFALPSYANDSYECTRTTVSQRGFSSLEAAKSWYFEEMYLVISDDQKWLANDYGKTAKRSKNEKKFNMGLITNREYDLSVHVDARKVTKENGGDMILTLTFNGYQESSPAKYKCGKASKTKWEPEEE